MFSRNDIKKIKSLEHKKFRLETGLFVAEGHKLVHDLMAHFSCVLYASTDGLPENAAKINADRVEPITRNELERASLQRSPQGVIALFRIPEYRCSMKDAANTSLVLALDGIQDPGNLGTIVRIADWFGIKDVFCSADTADIYGPKAVQATMGAMARVRLHYANLYDELKELPGSLPIYGTTLDGDDIYKSKLSSLGVIIMGNESSGIRAEIKPLVRKRLYIPSWPTGAATSESLNVAAATAIICAEFRRRGGQGG